MGAGHTTPGAGCLGTYPGVGAYPGDYSNSSRDIVESGHIPDKGTGTTLEEANA